MRALLGRIGLFVALASTLAAREGPKNAPSNSSGDRDYVHRGTGVVFPAKAPGFTRTDVTRFDKAGDDVGASYAAAPGFVATAYSYPMPPHPRARAAFAGAQAEIRQTHPGARLLREDAGRDGSLRAEYELTLRGGGGAPLRSQLLVFSKGGWLLKYRATYPAAARREGEEHLRAIMRIIGTDPLRGGRPARGAGMRL